MKTSPIVRQSSGSPSSPLSRGLSLLIVCPTPPCPGHSAEHACSVPLQLAYLLLNLPLGKSGLARETTRDALALFPIVGNPAFWPSLTLLRTEDSVLAPGYVPDGIPNGICMGVSIHI